MWWSQGDWGCGAWVVMSVSMAVFWALVIWIVLSVVRGSRGGTSERGANPERILAERFAAGEIDEDEYHQRLATLRDAGPAGRVGGPR